MKCEFFTEQEGGHKPGTVGEIGMTCPATTSVGQAFTAYERRRLIGRGVILPPLTGNSCSPSAERPESGRSGREAIAVERAPFAAQPAPRRRAVADVTFLDAPWEDNGKTAGWE